MIGKPGRAGLPVAIVFGVALLAGIAIYLVAHRDVGDIEAAKSQGGVLVDALERYRADTGAYPDSLQQLTPRYIASIHPPAWGLRWEYRRRPDAPTGFQLMVPENDTRFPLLFYDPVTRSWTLNQ